MLRMSRRAPVVRVAGAAAVGHHMGAKGAQLVEPRTSAPPVGPPVDDTVEQLMKLAHLHDVGALSDSEFAAAKARIVG